MPGTSTTTPPSTIRLGATPSFTRGDNGVYPIAVQVTDNDGLTATDSATVTVTNVDPAVTLDPAQDMVIAEGDTLDTRPPFTDPGYDDTYDARDQLG